jgi:hypothetical protein
LKANQLQEALKHYYDAYLQLRASNPSIKDPMAASLVSQKMKETSPEVKAQLEHLKRAVHGNMCVVYGKQDKWDRIVKMAEEVLLVNDGAQIIENIVPENIKLMFRLAKAKLQLGDGDRARYWTEKVLHLEPTNADVLKLCYHRH